MDEPVNTKEMSRYIDLRLYHEVEATHPYYLEMLGEVRSVIHGYDCAPDVRRILELGAGTGISTAQLATVGYLKYDAVEIDVDCYDLLRSVISERVNFICADARIYYNEAAYNIAVSIFAHDHIPQDQSQDFVKNIRRNLEEGGIYIMGGELLPLYSNADEYRGSLHRYHGFIIDQALNEGHFEVAKLEIDALRSGLNGIGDFKRHEELFEAEMLSADFRLLKKKKIGPLDKIDVGGVFVYVFEAI